MIRNLRSGTKYFVTVAAGTSAGYGPKSTEVSEKTRHEGKTISCQLIIFIISNIEVNSRLIPRNYWQEYNDVSRRVLFTQFYRYDVVALLCQNSIILASYKHEEGLQFMNEEKKVKKFSGRRHTLVKLILTCVTLPLSLAGLFEFDLVICDT